MKYRFELKSVNLEQLVTEADIGNFALMYEDEDMVIMTLMELSREEKLKLNAAVKRHVPEAEAKLDKILQLLE